MVSRDRERRATRGLQEDYGAGRNPLPPSASDLTASCRTVPTSAEDPSMKWIAAQTKWIMLISGILTTTILLCHRPQLRGEIGVRPNARRAARRPDGAILGDDGRAVRRDVDLRRLQTAAAALRPHDRGSGQG